jgi:hypothetical protein
MSRAHLGIAGFQPGRLSVEQLRDAIDAARIEAKRRLRELQSALD